MSVGSGTCDGHNHSGFAGSGAATTAAWFAAAAPLAAVAPPATKAPPAAAALLAAVSRLEFIIFS